jgi:hypothetical protein
MPSNNLAETAGARIIRSTQSHKGRSDGRRPLLTWSAEPLSPEIILRSITTSAGSLFFSTGIFASGFVAIGTVPLGAR